MWWTKIFKGQNTRRTRKKHHSTSLRNLFEVLRSDTRSLQLWMQTLQAMVDTHSIAIQEHTSSLEEQKVRVAKLEQLVDQAAVGLPARSLSQTGRPQMAIDSSRQHDIESFSPQEKRILTLFFQHPHMPLSYVDIAAALNKSANTVKNQMHQLAMKADLFERMVDAANRNRFKLKDGLKIDRYLNID
jgi:DNA-binding CsgD family transcriptional regulator